MAQHCAGAKVPFTSAQRYDAERMWAFQQQAFLEIRLNQFVSRHTDHLPGVTGAHGMLIVSMTH